MFFSRRITPNTAAGAVYSRAVRPRCVVKPYVPPPYLVPPGLPNGLPISRKPTTSFDTNVRCSSPRLNSPGTYVACMNGARQDRLLPGQIPVSYPLDRLHNALVKVLGERYLNLLDEFRVEHSDQIEIDNETMTRYLYLDFEGIS